jgi:hypothetical protein
VCVCVTEREIERECVCDSVSDRVCVREKEGGRSIISVKKVDIADHKKKQIERGKKKNRKKEK